MAAQILPLPGFQASTQPIGHYLRLGHTGHVQLGTLLARGRLPATRVVVDAAKLKFQKELLTALRAAGAQIVLDTNAAELSALERFDGVFKTAPWAAAGEGLPLQPRHFDPTSSASIIEEIAQFAVGNNVDAVLSPTHFLRNAHRDEWFEVDRVSCVALRDALDRNGGKDIGIDYLLMPTYMQLHDEVVRGAFAAALDSLPYDNLWVRASGFGADASPLGTRRYITAMAGLHNLGKPIVADHIGGLVGMATIAFGVVSGIAHGVGGHERFNASSWDKPRRKNEDGQQGGMQTRIVVPDLDKSLTIDELDRLARAKGGHRLVVCGDRNCCPHGLEDMKKDWRAHFLYQRFRQVGDLEVIPDQRRAHHFLEGDMATADRQARQIKELKVGDDKMTERLKKHSRRIESLRAGLENLYEDRGAGAPRALPVIRKSRIADDNESVKK